MSERIADKDPLSGCKSLTLECLVDTSIQKRLYNLRTGSKLVSELSQEFGRGSTEDVPLQAQLQRKGSALIKSLRQRMTDRFTGSDQFVIERSQGELLADRQFQIGGIVGSQAMGNRQPMHLG